MRAFGNLSGSQLDHAARMSQVEAQLVDAIAKFWKLDTKLASRRLVRGAAVKVAVMWGHYVEAARTAGWSDETAKLRMTEQVDQVLSLLVR